MIKAKYYFSKLELNKKVESLKRLGKWYTVEKEYVSMGDGTEATYMLIWEE